MPRPPRPISPRTFLLKTQEYLSWPLLTSTDSNIWDTHTGEQLYILQHDHIVRAVAYPPDNSELIATGGMEKKLRIFDLTEFIPQPGSPAPSYPITIPASVGFEIGEGAHTGAIKFIAWTKDPNIVVTASDNTLRWLDLPTRSVVHQEVLDGEIKSCELVSLSPEHSSPDDVGGGLPVLAVAAGHWVYFWGGAQAKQEIKRIKMEFAVASVGLDLKGYKFVVGEHSGTWAHVRHWGDGTEIGTPSFCCPFVFGGMTDKYFRSPQGTPRPHLVDCLRA
jgi:serine-threonine kinase receptor-associated protein